MAFIVILTLPLEGELTYKLGSVPPPPTIPIPVPLAEAEFKEIALYVVALKTCPIYNELETPGGEDVIPPVNLEIPENVAVPEKLVVLEKLAVPEKILLPE